jgi:tripartite-type tricarboxylate transporter receptor subunit TctC
VRCIVGYPAGGGTDIFVRLVAQPLSDQLGQPIVIENRPGATSNIAIEAYDIAVVGMAGGPNVIVVHPSVPAKTLPEFIAYAKENPGKINMASTGNGSMAHVGGELFKMMAGIDMVHVPYRGVGPAITDLLGGQVQVLSNGVAAVIEHSDDAFRRRSRRAPASLP